MARQLDVLSDIEVELTWDWETALRMPWFGAVARAAT